jgi:dTDP-4-amino-4,6-dideoxygalactose transaminase
MNIPISRPYLKKKEREAAISVIKGGWIGGGKKVVEFEKEVARYVDTPFAIAVNSCTTALYLTLKALGIGPKDEVIVPSLSFIAPANAVVHTGARPIFAEVDPYTFNIDPKKIESVLSKNTKAIMPVHQLGLAADLDKIKEITQEKKLLLIEDGACALGAEYKKTKIGKDSQAVCISFHPRKIITTGEGGMVLTRDLALAQKLQGLRSHGIEEGLHGYNFRMSDLQAAIGVIQMRRIKFLLKKRREQAKRYNESLGELSQIQIPKEPPYALHAYQSYMICILGITQNQRECLIQKMRAHGIQVTSGLMAIHLSPAFKDSTRKTSLKITERISRTSIMLPLYTSMRDKEQEYIIDRLKKTLKEMGV